MINNDIALIIALVLIGLVSLFVPHRRSFMDELEENARKHEKDRIDRMQK